MSEFPAVLLGIAAVLLLPMALVWALGAVFRALGFVVGGGLRLVGGLVSRTLRLTRGYLVDGVHAAGSGMTAGAMLPLTVGNLAIGRPRAAKSYGQALGTELSSLGGSLYRLAIGHPARFFGLSAVTDGLEKRLPDTIARARQSEEGRQRVSPKAALASLQARRKQGGEPLFEGYEIDREMVAGGSGARLFLATPQDARRADWRAAGHRDPGQVVIKAFDLEHGSTLPQIVRENRALIAARRLGLVLEHELTDGRFHYVMPFVPGDGLDVISRRLHERCGNAGLDDSALRRTLGFGCDLAATLGRFHREGLWHKDVKPSNLIVSGDHLHVVDLGLVTPLASSLTLTTHGTEYYRDPEMVRLAMQGVKVHEVDGVKFDLYSAGAVLYSMVENSFPAHGSLSRISKRCPDALAWIVRRCMADLATRYASADELGRDLAHVLGADNPYAVLPASLPSLARRSRASLPSMPPPPPVSRPALHRPVASAMPAEHLADVEGEPDSAPRGRAGLRVMKIGGLGVLLTAAALTVAADDGNERHAVVYFTDEDQGSYFNDEDRPDADSIRQVAQAQAMRELEQTLDFLNEEDCAEPQPLAVAVAAPRRGHPSKHRVPKAIAEGLSGHEGGVLVLRESGVHADRADLLQLADSLRQDGRAVYGLGGAGDQGVNLEARALAKVGLAQPGDPHAMQNLESLVASRSDLAAVLWAQQDGSEDRLSLYLVTE